MAKFRKVNQRRNDSEGEEVQTSKSDKPQGDDHIDSSSANYEALGGTLLKQVPNNSGTSSTGRRKSTRSMATIRKILPPRQDMFMVKSFMVK